MDPNYLRFWDGSQWTSNRAIIAGGYLETELLAKITALKAELETLHRRLESASDAMILQEVGVYDYAHPLDDAAMYRQALDDLEAEYKSLIKSGGAVTSTKKWIINGSDKEGMKMVTDLSKLMLRAYNNEVDNLLRTLKPYGIEKSIERLQKLRETIARLGASMKLGVTDAYHALRVRELRLTADYRARLEEEKERRREELERLREEELARREFEAEQARLEKERAHYLTVQQAYLQKGDIDAAEAAASKLAEINEALDGVIQRAANIRAGYVYVISNIGAFGERVVKIGLTRRLEPLDRVRELGGASVPFRFDVHALIFSDDAVTLENQLHRAFENSRVNLVNGRREYFYVRPADVRDTLLRLRGDLLTFTEEPLAWEWYESERRRGAAVSVPAVSQTPFADLPQTDGLLEETF